LADDGSSCSSSFVLSLGLSSGSVSAFSSFSSPSSSESETASSLAYINSSTIKIKKISKTIF